MSYVIIEIQTNSDGTIGVLTFTNNNRYEAEAVYHEKLAFAARSTLPKHAVVLTDNTGNLINYQCYEHGSVVG